MIKNKRKQGFTLIEILVAIGIIAILAGIVLIAINPARQFALARNTQRNSGVNVILNAIGQRMADNKGIFEGSFTIGSNTYTCPSFTAATAYNIASAVAAGNIDLKCLVPTYVATMPFDPSTGSWTDENTYDTKYTVTLGANGRFTVQATGAEIGQTISITR